METELKLHVKEIWKTPELIVLVRSKPEETVLEVCKFSTTLASGSNRCATAGNPCSTSLQS